MKQIVIYFVLLLLLVSCDSKNGYFRLEGHFLHFNQGELYVYSPDGAIQSVDTIKVKDGRFTYEIPSKHDATLVVIFPNYSTQPIFTSPGEAVKIKADASNLKEMEVSGTKENELMTEFRGLTAKLSPPKERETAINFVRTHLNSNVSVYLTNKYFIETPTPNYKQAYALVTEMLKEQPENGRLEMLKKHLEIKKNTEVGATLPSLSARTIDGKTIHLKDFKNQNLVINVWASWHYESMELQRIINEYAQNGKIKAIGICIDGATKEAKEIIKRDEITFPNVCDGQMFEGKFIQQLGIIGIPYNLLIQNGKIKEKRLTVSNINNKLENL